MTGMRPIYMKKRMNIKPKNLKIRKLARYCAICGKNIIIAVSPDKSYTGGHYFFKVKTEKDKQAEYWECNKGYKNP